jgi:gamma-glutamyltranspeptidase/glutathione hydrolase
MLRRPLERKLYAPFGVMGGFMQPQGHVQVVVGLADDALDPQAALDRPRFNILAGRPAGDVGVEDDIPEATCAELAKRGHAVQRIGGWGRVQFGRDRSFAATLPACSGAEATPARTAAR